jgi:integrase
VPDSRTKKKARRREKKLATRRARRQLNGIYRERYKVQRPDGTWEYRETDWWYIRYRDVHGLQRKVKAAPTKAQAREVRQQKLAEVADERAGIRRARLAEIRLRDLADRFLESRTPHVTPDHLKELRSALARVFKGTKSVFVADLDRTRVEKFMNRLASKGRAARTVNKILGHVKAMFNWAVSVGELHYNPLNGVKARPQHKKKCKRRALSESEIERLLAAARREKARPWEFVSYCLILYAGLRRSDVLNLVWADVDLDAALLTIRPENEKSRRGAVLPIHPSLAAVLLDRKREMPVLPTAAVAGMPKHPMPAFYKSLAAAGIQKADDAGRRMDLHALRHTFGTRLVRWGCDVKTVQMLMRHSTAALTLGVYVHSSRSREAAAVGRLPEISATPLAVENSVRNGTTDEPVESNKARVRRDGVEGTRNPFRDGMLAASAGTDFESGASASSATPARPRTSASATASPLRTCLHFCFVAVLGMDPLWASRKPHGAKLS